MSVTAPTKEHEKKLLEYSSGRIKPMKLEDIEEHEKKQQEYSGDRIKPMKLEDINVDPFGGRLLQDGVIYSQNVTVRSSEIGSTGKISIGALVHHLQDTSLDHVNHLGLLDQGFGSTVEMSRNDLVWVVNTLQIEVERYPSWGETVTFNTWIYSSGRNGIGRNWLLYDERTGEILIRANSWVWFWCSVYVMMNKKTRKLAKLVQSVRDEFGLSLTDDVSIFPSDTQSRYQIDVNTADYVCTSLKSIPHSFMACHELSAITLGYRKECHMNSVLQSMSKMVKNSSGHIGSGDDDVVEFEHLVSLEDGSRILKARTTWKPKEIHLNGI
ncbi:hypothetical protein Tsubulata_025728, partial [Turnera subulata]